MKKSIKNIGMVAIAAIFILITIIMAELVRKKKPVGSDAARGIRNNNPLNLRRTNIVWKHEKIDVSDNEFEEFDSLMWGLRAGLRNMRTKIQQGYKTLGSLVSVWAPPSENNTSNYIEIVSKETGYESIQDLEFEKDFMFPIVKSMCKIESKLELTRKLYEEAWENI